MDNPEHDLIAAQEKLRLQQERSAGQRKYRDETLSEAMKAGLSWKRAQQITGLSRRGVQIALERHRGGTQ